MCKMWEYLAYCELSTPLLCLNVQRFCMNQNNPSEDNDHKTIAPLILNPITRGQKDVLVLF